MKPSVECVVRLELVALHLHSTIRLQRQLAVCLIPRQRLNAVVQNRTLQRVSGLPPVRCARHLSILNTGHCNEPFLVGLENNQQAPL